MGIHHLTTGPLSVNTFILHCEGTNEMAIIDPGGDEKVILTQLSQIRAKLTHILLTHGHFDHIGAVRALKNKTGASVCIHSSDHDMLTNPKYNLSSYMNFECVQSSADILLEDGDIIRVGEMEIVVIHTPGHSPGSICLRYKDVIFTGDTLFRMSIGRTDFPGGDLGLLCNSVQSKLFSLKEDLTLYPGHGEFSSLDNERSNNPFLMR